MENPAQSILKMKQSQDPLLTPVNTGRTFLFQTPFPGVLQKVRLPWLFCVSASVPAVRHLWVCPHWLSCICESVSTGCHVSVCLSLLAVMYLWVCPHWLSCNSQSVPIDCLASVHLTHWLLCVSDTFKSIQLTVEVDPLRDRPPAKGWVPRCTVLRESCP